MHSIRTRITAMIIVAILTCVLILGGISILGIDGASDQSTIEKMNLMSENMQQKLDAYFSSIQQSVDMGIRIAGDGLDALDLDLFDTNKTEEETKRLNGIIAGHCQEVEHAFESIASHTNGIVTYYYCINDDLGSGEHGFFWRKTEEGAFEKQPDLISSDLDINDTEHTIWYYNPIKNGRPVWVGPYPAHFLGEALTVSYVAPIYRFGFLIGVMGMDILMDTITDTVRSFQIYDTGYVFLMDQEGKIIYHPTLAYGTDGGTLFPEVTHDLLKRSSNGDQLVRYNNNGTAKQMAFSTMKNKIKVGVTAPVSEITASTAALSRRLTIAAVLILILFIVLSTMTVSLLTKPLMRLSAASQRLEEGDYDVELDYNGKDEIGTLTRSFRHMRDHMKQYISDLNSKAYTDSLTGVRNAGALHVAMDRLNGAIHNEGQAEKPEFAVVVFDCNRLKEINDRYGHEHGDLYLKKACGLICDIYAHSPVFRMGGDEFAVLLQYSDYENRDELLEQFDRRAEENNAAAREPWETINISKGMAYYMPESDTGTQDVLSRADNRMYEEKRSTGRGTKP